MNIKHRDEIIEIEKHTLSSEKDMVTVVSVGKEVSEEQDIFWHRIRPFSFGLKHRIRLRLKGNREEDEDEDEAGTTRRFDP